MIPSFFLHTRKQYVNSVSIPIFVLSLFLATIFVSSCGNEGDTTEDTSMTGVLQPATTPPTTAQTPVPAGDPGVVEEPILEEPKVSFKDDIQPVLAERCAVPGCHVAGHFTGLDLSQYDTFKKGGNGGPAFVAGNGNGSLVVKRIDGGGMPPGGPPLDADQVQLFIDWIDEGAENN